MLSDPMDLLVEEKIEQERERVRVRRRRECERSLLINPGYRTVPGRQVRVSPSSDMSETCLHEAPTATGPFIRVDSFTN